MIYDVVVVGGGLIGVSLARALASADADISVALVDAVRADSDQHPSYDDRAIALAEGSMRIFAALGAATRLREESSPIDQVHVSDRGHFGFTRLNADEAGLDALGYVTDARTLGSVLNELLTTTDGVDTFIPAEVVSVDTNSADEIAVGLHERDSGRERTLRGRLLVAADGGRSRVRSLVGVESDVREFGQSAVTANVTPGRPHRQVAYERFTDTGPIALLPMTNGRSGLIWTLPTESAEQLMQLDERAFAGALAERFGSRLGEFSRIGVRSCHPLSFVEVREQVRHRTVIAGNAAHTLHPVAGQGLNLGLRDVAALAETVVAARRHSGDVADPQHLQSYQAWRRAEQRNVVCFTNSIVRLFSNQLPLLTTGRSLGLVLLDTVPVMKRWFLARATGLAGRQSRLARGLPL